MTGEWLSLQQLRDLNVFVEDPRTARIQFIHFASEGNLEKVKRCLLSGEDVGATDHTGCTALHAAAVGNHFDIVELLLKNGADINARDKNMMTPLLCVIRRKLHDMMRLLLSSGADRTCTDRIHRNALYFAVKSGDIGMVRTFLGEDGCNMSDTLWGWTPLHVAANQGDLTLTRLLCEAGSSIFYLAKDGRIPEQVARDAGHNQVVEYLEEKRLTAPAQLTYQIKSSGINLWIGEQSALDPKFVHDAGYDAMLIFTTTDQQPKRSVLSRWLKDEESIRYMVIIDDRVDDEDQSDLSW
eukprot:CAMPEP_0174820256 /NCGR_PEP_ID=MMETSP1107-20130205/3960_1 /TAXON_ID=36770 /ORGANISM="Paraphysomonas vestita, Strain GFlagA" /LENGTH=296 /DNA_ID=CAMNT_0016035215 /DNA_START=806 /DNA_END=1693 /DNA_ORIENTATION=-